MLKHVEDKLEGGIAALAEICQTYRWLVLAGAVVLVLLAGSYTARNIAIDTDTTEMLSAELPWRQTYAAYQQAFPYFSDTLVVVLDAATPDLALEASSRLAESLRRDTEHFSEVFNPAADDVLLREQLLYLELDEIEALTTELSSAQAFLGQLAADPGLNGLLTVLEQIVEHGGDRAGLRLADVLETLARSLDELAAGNTLPMSWQSLLTGSVVAAPRRVIFTAKPTLDYSEVLPAAAAMESFQKTLRDLGYDRDDSGVQIRLTGGAALAYDELRSVIRGAEQSALLAFIMVALCLLAALRSLPLVLVTLVALAAGLVLTAGFATLVVGTLNMISIAFAVLYVGLGVDFAIHVCLRYRELAGREAKRQAITATIRHVGVSLVLCATTTAIAFFAFLPTSYRGVAELGLISGMGILIGLLVSLTVLPALLSMIPQPRTLQVNARTGRLLGGLSSPGQAPRILLGALVVALLAGLCLPAAYFDKNPLHLNDPQAESVRTLEELDRDGSMSAIAILLDDADRLDRLVGDLDALSTVRAVVEPRSLIPTEQAQKLALVDELNFTLGGALGTAPATPLPAQATIERLRSLQTGFAAAGGDSPAAAAERALAAALARTLEPLSAGSDREAVLTAIEYKLMHHLPAQLTRLELALEADGLSLETLPANLKKRWISSQGPWRVEVYPYSEPVNNAELTAFVDQVRGVAGDAATGAPVINLEAADAVLRAFKQAFLTAIGLIAVLLWVLLRRVRDIIIVFAPLTLAALLTCAGSVLLNIPFNFANIIALPLLMGIGVDSAVHMLHRYRTLGEHGGSLLQSSSARAVLYSALTTGASFGNLAISPHAGTASMGLMLTVGLITTTLATLIVLPALLRRFIPVTGTLA